jgi:polygalacturonase
MRIPPSLSRLSAGLLAATLAASFPASQCRGQSSHDGFTPPAVQEPAFADHSVSIVDFGAVPDGKTLNTEAFAKAIDAINKQGGGMVIVPPGLWLTGPIRFKSNINLHLKAGALIQFTTDYKQFPLIVLDVKGEKAVTSISPLWGEMLENIAITGRGVIDGGGNAWRPVKKGKLTEGQWKQRAQSGGVLTEKGDTWWPSREAMQGGALVSKLEESKSVNIADYEPAHQFLRPTLLKFVNCRRVLFEGVTFQNSPNWNLHPLLCVDVTIRGVTVRAPWTAQNSDALDLESCRNVIVRDSSFDVGDDGICLKSGIDEAGRRIGVPTENVLIENCVVYHGHGGFTIGSEMSGGVRNVHINNCVFIGTDIGLRFKSTRGRGGAVEKIYISNIRMVDIPGDAISFSMFYGGKAPLEENGQTAVSAVPAVNEGTPQFRDFYLENITCRGAKTAVSLRGLPEMPIRGIHMKNVSITSDAGMDWTDADNIHLENVEIINTAGPALQVQNAKNSSIDRLGYRNGVDAVVVAKGSNDITVRNTDMKKAVQGVVAAGGADASQIKVK